MDSAINENCYIFHCDFNFLMQYLVFEFKNAINLLKNGHKSNAYILFITTK